MGTPEFAVESLRRLVEAHYNVVAVVTMPDKPKGRHHDVLTPSPVKVYAQQVGIPVLQPVRLKDEQFVEQLRTFAADLQVVVAFRMLPAVVWRMPRLGTFNLHASLLPQYRGAAPINWAIINGETTTGVTTFFLDHEVDTGLIITSRKVPIHETDDAGTLHDRLMNVGAELVLEAVSSILNASLTLMPQCLLCDNEALLPAPKIFKETCEIKFASHTVRTAYNFVRGLSPYPCAWTTLDGKQLKIFQTALPDAASSCSSFDIQPGTVDSDGKTFLRIACTDGWLHVLSLQLEGKRRMPVADFLRGYVWQG